MLEEPEQEPVLDEAQRTWCYPAEPLDPRYQHSFGFQTDCSCCNGSKTTVAEVGLAGLLEVEVVTAAVAYP